MDTTVDPAVGEPPGPPPPGSDALLGRLLDGRYRLDRRIAQGGMATVYAATDTRLDRTVAVKVMRAALAEDPDFVQRFAREARAAAKLSSPEVVAVHDQGTDGATGTAYLVMEHVDGGTLRDLLVERGPLPPRRALELMEPVLRALAAAHAAGLVHRDVKPENVLLAADGRVKVADFGLARAVETSGLTATTGLLIGTVSYLAPEQVEHGLADPRTDVYAAGTMLFELLTGAPPYASESPLSVAYRHVNEDVPAPSSMVEGVPRAVDELVLRATRRDPSERPVDAGAFLAELSTVRSDLGDGPTGPVVRRPTLVVPRPDTPPRADDDAEPTGDERPPRIRLRPRRRHVLWALVVLLLVPVALAGGWYLGSGRFADVPAVLDLPTAEASTVLEQAGFAVELLEGRHDEQVAVDHVLEQDPAPNERIRRGATVGLVPSLGPDRRVVPSLIGVDRAAAEQALTGVGLRVATVTEEFSPRDEGTVLSSDPPAGERLRPGTGVALVVSKGLEMLDVPDVRGQDRAAAEAALNAAGFRAGITEVFSEDQPRGRVIGQDPASGRLPRDAAVALQVSRGPELITLPELVGRPRDEAVAALERLGLEVRVTAIPGPGTVRSMQPGAGSEVRKRSTVTLFVF